MWPTPEQEAFIAQHDVPTNDRLRALVWNGDIYYAPDDPVRAYFAPHSVVNPDGRISSASGWPARGLTITQARAIRDEAR